MKSFLRYISEEKQPNVECMRCGRKANVAIGGYVWKSGKAKCPSCGGAWDEIQQEEKETKEVTKPSITYPAPGRHRSAS